MKNLNLKIMKLLLSIGLLLPLAALKAKAGNPQDAWLALQNAVPMSAVVFGSVAFGGNYGQGNAINLFYKGSSTEAYAIINTANQLSFQAPFGSTDTANVAASLGGGGIIPLTSTVTIGSVCDIINNSVNGVYGCKLVGAIRSDASTVILSSTFPISGGSAASYFLLNGAGGFNVPIGTTTIISLGIIPAPFHRVSLYSVQAFATNASGSIPLYLQVYGQPRKFGNGKDNLGAPNVGNLVNDSYQVFQASVTSAAINYFPINSGSSSPVNPWQTFAPDQHVVIRVGANGDGSQQGGVGGNSTSGLTPAPNYIEAFWREE